MALSGERGESGEETNDEEDVDEAEDSDGEMEHEDDLLIFDRNELYAACDDDDDDDAPVGSLDELV